MKKYGKYYATMGLEIHVALKTKTKLFSRSINDFETEDISLFDAGVPGMLPVISDKPVEMAVAFGLATQSEIAIYSEFERKHYFYPDLPLGYQITQQHKPILLGGTVPITTEDGEKLIQIEHSHLECDAAKSIHTMYNNYTAIDLSRCASPLLEIVSTPCMHSPEEAKEYAKAVHGLALFLGICDGKMEEGSFRVDASISLHTEEGKLGTRVEVKNISSFGFLEAALYHEIERQTEILNKFEKVIMETRLFDEATMTTKSMRLKETVDEYRYMPDPDILPLIISQNFIEKTEINYPIHYFKVKNKLLSLVNEYKMDTDVHAITQLLVSENKSMWMQILSTIEKPSEKLLRILAYWLPEVQAKLLKYKKYKFLILADLIYLEKSQYQAKEVKEGLLKWYISDMKIEDCMPKFIEKEVLQDLIKSILSNYTVQVDKFKNGEIKLLQFLIGKVMAEVKSKAPANVVKEEVEFILNQI